MASRTSLRRHQGSAPEEPAATNAGGNASNCYELTVVPGNLKERPNTITFLPLFGDGNSDRWPKLDGQPGVGGSTFVRLGKEHEKNRIWRSLAADYIARELGLYDDVTARHWILGDLPTGYALMERQGAPRTEGPADTPPRIDRFIFGNEGRKLRSALNLGKHLSWLLLGAIGACPCDCNSKSSNALSKHIPPVAGPPESETAVQSISPITKTKTVKRKLSPAIEEKPAVLPPVASTSSRIPGAKRGRPRKQVVPKAAPGRRPFHESSVALNPVISNALGSTSTSAIQAHPEQTSHHPSPRKRANVANRKNEFDSMLPISKDFTEIGLEGEEERSQYNSDAGWISVPRVGELVWHPVPLAMGLWGQKKIEYWPAVVRKSAFAENVVVHEGTVIRGIKKLLRLELILLGEIVENVDAIEVIPWLGFEPSKLEDYNMGGLGWKIQGKDSRIRWDELARKRSREALASEGRDSVGRTFALAWRTSQWISVIQIRSPPEIESGLHLIAESQFTINRVPTRGELVPSTSAARYLSHSWISFGPEVLHLGDYVRLIPNADLPHFAISARSSPNPSAVQTCLVLRISKLLRGGTGSPLIVRGNLFEMEEDTLPEEGVSSEERHEFRRGVDSIMPPPFPIHSWKCLAPSVDLLLESSVAGKYCPLGTMSSQDPDDVQIRAGQTAIANARQALKEGKTGSVELRKLLLAGVEIANVNVPRIETLTGVEQEDTVERRRMALVAAMSEFVEWSTDRGASSASSKNNSPC